MNKEKHCTTCNPLIPGSLGMQMGFCKDSSCGCHIPTQPTEEKEPNFVKVNADAFKDLKLEVNVEVEPPSVCCEKCKCGFKEPDNMCHDFECICHSKPTQDTESWEEEFESKFVCAYSPSDLSSSASTQDIKDFIKSKKSEWVTEAMATTRSHYYDRVAREARTQGAEAAVKYIEEHSKLMMPTYEVDEDVLEEAKKV